MNFIDVYEMARTVGIDHRNAMDLTFIALDNLYQEDDVIFVPAYLALRSAGKRKHEADAGAKRYLSAVKALAKQD
jgi:hypothetical protein